MAEPTEIVQVIKQESAALGGDAADELPFDAPINPQEDVIEAAGCVIQDLGNRDSKVKFWRDSGSFSFKDEQNSRINLTELQSHYSGSAANYDFLLDNEPSSTGTDYTNVLTANKITNETWRRTSGSLLLKTIDYAYVGNFVSQEVRKVYDPTGAVVVAQLTFDYTYLGGTVLTISGTRDI